MLNLLLCHKRVLIKRFVLISVLNLLAIPVHINAAESSRVKIASIADVAIYPQRSAPAVVMSLNESVLSAQLDARVDKLPVRVGDVVQQGDTLAQLDCSDYILARRQSIARLEALEARFNLAKRRLQRTRQLSLEQSVAEEALDQHEAEHAVLHAELKDMQAELEIKKLNESRCSITSPFHALVIERISAPGEFVKIGSALLRVMDLHAIEISAQILNRDTEQIRHNKALFFEHDDLRYPVKLRTILQTINPETRNRQGRLVFLDRHALPGATGKLIWRDNRAHIPSHLLVHRDGELGIFTVEDNIARFNPIPKAQAGRSNIIDLSDEKKIVIEGHLSLTEARPVDIID